MIDLRPLYAPRSIAVVGASPRSDLARTVRDNLVRMGSPARCHFVNPNHAEVDGSPCFPSLAALPERPDSVVLAVNPLRATAFAREAAEAGVPALVIPGGGVVEGGEAAALMQREVAAICAANGVALLGPNCMGMVDLTTNVATYIGEVQPHLRRGHVAAILQSGSVADACIHHGRRVGWSRIVSIGAEGVLDLCDHLAWSLDDPETHAVVLFLEGFRRPERFLALADRALAMGKPILAVKVGRSRQSRAAAVAHTGNLAGDDRVADAALEAAGVVRCADLDELLEAAELHAGADRLGRRVGAGRTGVVTVSTGEASLVADLAPAAGVELAPVPAAARATILRDLPTMGHVDNPLDPWGAADAPDAYRAAFEAFAASSAFDVLVAVHDSPYADQAGVVEVATTVTRALLDAASARPGVLPVYLSLTSGEPSLAIQAMLDDAGGVPLLRGATEALRAIAGRARWEAWRARRLAEGPWRATWPALSEDRTPWGIEAHDREGAASRLEDDPTPVTLPERESLDLAASAGIPVTPYRAVALDADAAIGAARELGGGPVAIKLDAVGMAHKSDSGGVCLGVAGGDEIRVAVAGLAEAAARARAAGAQVRGLVVQPMAGPGVEIIVGAYRDDVFGPAVIVGLGGVLAEAFDDVAVLLAPSAPAAVHSAIARLRASALLREGRGRPAADLEALVAIVVAVSRLVADRPDIAALDLNPVVVGPTGAVVVDALAVVWPAR